MFLKNSNISKRCIVIIKSWPLILDPITTLLSLLFITIFVRNFSIESYGEFVILSALFALVLNNNWGLDGAAKSFLGEEIHSDGSMLNVLYLGCLVVSISLIIIFLFFNKITNFFYVSQELFILSALIQLSVAVAGITYLEEDNIISERLVNFIFNNINMGSLAAVVIFNSSIAVFYETRLILILIFCIIIHLNFCNKIFKMNIIKLLLTNMALIIKRVFKYYAINFSASVIWTLNPLVLALFASEQFIAIFNIYFRLTGILMTCLGYFNSWATIILKNAKNKTLTQLKMSLKRIYSIFLPLSIFSGLFYISLSPVLIELWLGERLTLAVFELICLGLWISIIILLLPLNQMLNIFDMVDYKFVFFGILLAFVHVTSLFLFDYLFKSPLVAFLIGVSFVSTPVCAIYSSKLFKELR